MKINETALKAIGYTTRSAWKKGVVAYAEELLENGSDRLNGAKDWKHYSYSGCALCYDVDIAARLSNATELKRTNGGLKAPNAKETWLDVQARALYQANELLKKLGL